MKPHCSQTLISIELFAASQRKPTSKPEIEIYSIHEGHQQRIVYVFRLRRRFVCFLIWTKTFTYLHRISLYEMMVPEIFCKYGRPAKMIASWTNYNLGRRYFSCSVRKVRIVSQFLWLWSVILPILILSLFC